MQWVCHLISWSANTTRPNHHIMSNNNYKYPDTRIVIFAKAPIAGLSKTRLQPELSPEQSAALQTKLITHICHIASDSQLCPVELWCTPDINHPVFASIASKLNLHRYQQQGDSLGERLLHCLQTAPQQSTLILGTDCPYLEKNHLDQLISAINQDNKDISIIPAHDGGYVALACQGLTTSLFEDISWGSDQVYQQTIAAANKQQLKIKALLPLSDVDRYADYLEMCKNLPNLKI